MTTLHSKILSPGLRLHPRGTPFEVCIGRSCMGRSPIFKGTVIYWKSRSMARSLQAMRLGISCHYLFQGCDGKDVSFVSLLPPTGEEVVLQDEQLKQETKFSQVVYIAD